MRVPATYHPRSKLGDRYVLRAGTYLGTRYVPRHTYLGSPPMDINSPSSSEEESGDDDEDDPQQGGAHSEQPAASDAVETLVISFNGGAPKISGSSLGAAISELTRGNVRDATAVHLILLAQPKLALCPLSRLRPALVPSKATWR